MYTVIGKKNERVFVASFKDGASALNHVIDLIADGCTIVTITRN